MNVMMILLHNFTQLSSKNECDNIWKANLTIKLVEYLVNGEWHPFGIEVIN